MSETNYLEIAFQQTSWDVVNEARRLGVDALPVVEKYSQAEDYKKRQIAMASAGAIHNNEVAPVLSTGLNDANVNVRLEAAKAINENPNPGVTDAVLEKLQNSPDEVVREILALAAGKLPGEQTVEVLKKVQESDEGQVSVNAQMALARLGDTEAKQAIVKQLGDAVAGIRYHALEKLIYIKDRSLASYAKRLLSDKTDAVRFGNIAAPKYRRVCDQAVETIIFLLGLSVSFRVSKEKLYSDKEIREVLDASARG